MRSWRDLGDHDRGHGAEEEEEVELDACGGMNVPGSGNLGVQAIVPLLLC